ncbi:MAG: hypothetical protein A2X64_05210 [Ignavibacteria bacterium GWF2_33_9]|nr:MAG: hypothetical protein A2X64_05210 [Ignavibacteria bacterium GWF2_33_9]
MKSYKTEIINTTFFTGKMNQFFLMQVLENSSKEGWELKSSITLVRGLIFKKIQNILIFEKSN